MAFSFDDLFWEREIRRCRGGDDPESQLDGFVYWCETYAWIEHPKGRRHLELREAQLLPTWDLLNHEQCLILKARQIEFTTLTMNFALSCALFTPDWSCINLSRRQEDAEDALGKAIFAYKALPDELRARLPERTDRGISYLDGTGNSGKNLLGPAAMVGNGTVGPAVVVRYTSNDKADARFQTLEFKGRRLFFDLGCQSGRTYFLNSRYLHLKGHKSVWMSPTDFKNAPDKDAEWMQVLLYGHLTCSNRSRQAVVINQTAS